MAIRHKRKSTPGYAWQSSDLVSGQIGVNVADGTLHILKDNSTVKTIDVVNQIGHVFPSDTERDAYANIYAGMISRQIDTDTDTQYDGANWVVYTGALPVLWVGAPVIADVIGHLPDGRKYEEEA